MSGPNIILYKFIILVSFKLPQRRVKGNNESIASDTEPTLIMPIGRGYSKTLNINSRDLRLIIVSISI